jgi:hypothetical protein
MSDKYTGPRDFDEQTDAFRFDLDDMCDRYLEEFDINVFTIAGALMEKIKELLGDDIVFNLDEPDEEEDDENLDDFNLDG